MLKAARDARFVGLWTAENARVNLSGNYDYLEASYYISQDYEESGDGISPTCKEMLDAYVPPLFLHKAHAAGLPTPGYYLSNGHFDPPVIIDPVNPFSLKGRVVAKPGREQSIARSLTRNFTYAICCQELPPGSKVAYFRCLLGWSTTVKYRDLARGVWEVFRVPLARIRVIHDPHNGILISEIAPLPIETLGRRELHYIEERVTWGA